MDSQTEKHPLRRKEDRPSRRLRKGGIYILPSIFTVANVAAGYYAILQAIHGMQQGYWHFDNAAKAIGFAVLFDGLDGRIARMTHTESAFGRELDSLADVITFGVAPALLAWMWGFHFLPPTLDTPEIATWFGQFGVAQLGVIASFLFLVAGASRLARFNIDINPQPSNPGRPGKKYFVGMPIPAGAGVVAAIVHFTGGAPLGWWVTAVTWVVLLFVVASLMISKWRFYSFKDLHFGDRQPFQLIALLALLFAAIWFFSRPVLFIIALTYMFSGIFWRLQWIFRRKRNPPPPSYKEVSQPS